MRVDDAAAVTAALFERFSVRADDRPPNVIRLAPAPLYNTYDDCWRAASALIRVLDVRTPVAEHSDAPQHSDG